MVTISGKSDSGEEASWKIEAGPTGIMLACMDAVLPYIHDRKQFGQAIGKFQMVAFKIADIGTRLDAARLLMYRAAWLKDQGRRHTKEAAMAKLTASEAGGRVVDRCMQMFGGLGVAAAGNR